MAVDTQPTEAGAEPTAPIALTRQLVRVHRRPAVSVFFFIKANPRDKVPSSTDSDINSR